MPAAAHETVVDPAALSAYAAERLDEPTSSPIRIFLLGATGRTGSLFLSQALRRGHHVTAYVRDASKLPRDVKGGPRLQVCVGELNDVDEVTRVMATAAPDVVCIMLASEKPPYTALSVGTRSMLRAIRAFRPAPDRPSRMPLISIAGWGAGPSWAYLRPSTRLFVNVTAALFYSKPLKDFERQTADIEEAAEHGLIRPIMILPTILTNGKRSETYLAGEASRIANAMGFTRFVSRASVADLCLKLAERAAAGRPVPEWIGVINARRRR